MQSRLMAVRAGKSHNHLFSSHREEEFNDFSRA